MRLNQKGYVAFISILIVAAATLAIVTSISLLGVGEAQSSLDHKKGLETLTIAKACAEEGLYRLRNSSNYSGGSINVGNGSCTIGVSIAENNYLINVSASLSGAVSYSKRVELLVARTNHDINILSWSELE